MTPSHKFGVTPAKAGVHGQAKLRLRPWIPAFAGMTDMSHDHFDWYKVQEPRRTYLLHLRAQPAFSQMQKTLLKCRPTREIQALVRQCRPTHISKFAHWGAKFWKGAPQGKAEGNDAARPAGRLTVEAAFFASSRYVPDRLSPKFRKGQNKCWINVVS
jgi:hypothetical protein